MQHTGITLFVHRSSLIAVYGKMIFETQCCYVESVDYIFPLGIARSVPSAFQLQNANKTWPVAIYIGLTLGQQRVYLKSALSFPLSISIEL